jgi:hypothetical protein
MPRLNSLDRLAEVRPEIAANPMRVMDADDRVELLRSLFAESAAAVPDGSWSWSRRHRKGIGMAIGTAAAVACLVVGVVLLGLSPSPQPSGAATTLVSLHSSAGTVTGRIPNDAIAHGRIDWSEVPSYIPVYSGKTFVGLVKKADVEHLPFVASPLIKPLHLPSGIQVCRLTSGVDVYNRTHSLIGHIVRGTGFVPLGLESTCQP